MRMSLTNTLTDNERRQIAKIIHRTLMSQKFADWHAGEFEDYITGEFAEGDPRRLSEEQMLERIADQFSLKNPVPAP